jgi:hypothetical protein
MCLDGNCTVLSVRCPALSLVLLSWSHTEPDGITVSDRLVREMSCFCTLLLSILSMVICVWPHTQPDGVPVSGRVCSWDVTFLFCVFQWRIIDLSPPEALILPRVSGRCNHLGSCISMDDTDFLAVRVSNTTLNLQEIRLPSIVYLNGWCSVFGH